MARKKLGSLRPATISSMAEKGFFGEGLTVIRQSAKDKDGYPRTLVVEGGKLKTVYTHRLVIQKSIGRKLLSSEHVHHINGNKEDFRLENLAMLPKEQHWALHGAMKKKRRKTSSTSVGV